MSLTIFTKVNENMHIQEPVENLILCKMAWADLSKLFRICSRDTYSAKKQKIILQFIPGQTFFSLRLTRLIF